LKKIERINDALKNHDVFKNYEEYTIFIHKSESIAFRRYNLSLKLARTTCDTTRWREQSDI